MVRITLALSAGLLLALVSRAGVQDPTARYEKVHKIEIGGEGGWDFLEVDPATPTALRHEGHPRRRRRHR